MADTAQKSKESKALTPKEDVAISVDSIMPLIERDSDFVTFRGRNGKQNIEPTRDLALKLIKNFKLSYDTTIEEAGDKRFIVKAVVWDEKNHKASGLGLCTFDEVQYSKERMEHDALTKAETRAIKRAIESLAGQAVINRLIMAVFGSFEVDDEPRNVTPPKNPEKKESSLYAKYLTALAEAHDALVLTDAEYQQAKDVAPKHKYDGAYFKDAMDRLEKRRKDEEGILAANTVSGEPPAPDITDEDAQQMLGGGK